MTLTARVRAPSPHLTTMNVDDLLDRNSDSTDWTSRHAFLYAARKTGLSDSTLSPPDGSITRMTPTLSAFFRANLSLPLLAFESLAPADIEGPALVELTGPEEACNPVHAAASTSALAPTR